MSDRPIQVGDLVQVVKPGLCGCTTTLGWVFVVLDEKKYSVTTCGTCNAQFGRLVLLESGIQSPRGDSYGFRRSALKRVPPLSELEDQRTQEDMKEPA